MLKNDAADDLRQALMQVGNTAVGLLLGGATQGPGGQMRPVQGLDAKATKEVVDTIEARYGKEQGNACRTIINGLRDIASTVKDDITKDRL